MLPDLEFKESNDIYYYKPGFDLKVHKTQTDENELVVISKWKLSKEDLEFINQNGYIYLSIIGGQPPVQLFAEEIFY